MTFFSFCYKNYLPNENEVLPTFIAWPRLANENALIFGIWMSET
jgi:hypothetical protein